MNNPFISFVAPINTLISLVSCGLCYDGHQHAWTNVDALIEHKHNCRNAVDVSFNDDHLTHLIGRLYIINEGMILIRSVENMSRV